jgi:anti-sigma B factor antagonist
MDIESKNGKQVVTLQGEINGASGLDYKQEISKLFDSSTVVVVSFKGVVYLNSSGLREMIDLLKIANKSKIDLRLCDMSKDIREMFSFTGLEKVFKIYNTSSEALV